MVLVSLKETNLLKTTLSNGYLGSGNDEERSEMRYVMRIAEFSESSNLRTQIALPGYSWEHASSSIGYYLRSTLARQVRWRVSVTRSFSRNWCHFKCMPS